MKAAETFGLFSDRVIELCNHVFSPMYRRVFKKYWDNSVFARMRRPYFESDIQDGYYEIYIPTFEDIEGWNMRYYRIVVRTVPELDKETLREESLKLRRTRVANGRGAAGRIDSELIIIVAPKRSDEARKQKQFLRAYRTYPRVKGFLTAPVINPDPETCAERIVRIISNFLKRRIKALLRSFRLERLYDQYYREERLYYSNIVFILEKISLSIANAVKCLSHSLNWLSNKLRHIRKEIVRQRRIWDVLREIKKLKPLLEELRKSPRYLRNEQEPRIIKGLMEVLQIAEGPRLKAG